MMRATLILNGKPRDVHAIVGLALESNTLEAFTTDADAADERRSTGRGSRGPQAASVPFTKGDRVMKKWQTSKSQIARFTTGRVTEVMPRRGGWAVRVSWDDPKYDTDWIMASALAIAPSTL